MRDTIIQYILAGVVSMSIFCSCVEDVEIDTREDLPIVVDCILKMKPMQELHLYKMRNVYGDEIEPVTVASVELFLCNSNGDEYSKVSDFKYVNDGKWEAYFKPDYEKSYKLKISIPGEEVIVATTTFPPDLRLVLQSKYLIDDKNLASDNDYSYYLMQTADVALGTILTKEDFEFFGRFEKYYRPNYYPDSFKAYIPDNTKACKMWIYPHADSTLVLKNLNYYTAPWEVSKLPFIETSQPFCDLVVTDHPGADNFNLVSGSVSGLDIVNVPINTETVSHYLPLEYGPPGTLYLSTGLVANYSQWCKILCPNLPVHKQFVRIEHPSGFWNGIKEEDLKRSYQFSTSSFLILGNYTNYSSGLEPFLIEVRFLSDEYDSFLRDLYVKNLSKDDFILSTYNRYNIYTNIQGGVGVFGAENDTWAERSFFSSAQFEEISL